MAQEIFDLKTGSLITISHGCFAANWTKTEHDNNGPNCGLSWVFSKHLGQALVAKSAVAESVSTTSFTSVCAPETTLEKPTFPASKRTRTSTPWAITFQATSFPAS